MKRIVLTATIGTALFVIGCDAPPTPRPPAPVQRQPLVTSAPPPKTVTVHLEALGLRFEGSKNCSVKDLSEKQSLKQRIHCPGAGFDVAVPSKAEQKTFEQAKKAEHVHGHLVVTKEEKTDGGWNIQFHSSDLGTDVFEVWIRRTIEGKPYDCTSTASSADEASKAAAICENLAHA
jgi:hypothetical protein